jgi:hypothetical protein
MRSSRKVIVFLAMVLTAFAAQTAMAGITAIEGPVDINGTLESARPCNGAGFVVATESGEETVFGIGPISYWNELGVTLPEVGEYVEIEAYEVTYADGTSKLVAYSITIADGAVTVQLRDDDFMPLWTQKKKGN